MKYDLFKHNCYDLYTIKTDNFSITRIEIVFKLKCTKENISFLALLFDVLMYSSNKYKTAKELTRALERLYDANMYSSITRVGKMLIASAVIEVLDSDILNKSLVCDAIDMIFECIFNPNLINGLFPYKIVEITKRNILDEIKSVKEDVKQSSILESLKLLGSDDIRSLSISGDEEILKNITPESLYEFYRWFLNESIKDVYVLGNINPNQIDKYIFDNIKFNSIPLL